jgi:hypothetical protein
MTLARILRKLSLDGLQTAVRRICERYCCRFFLVAAVDGKAAKQMVDE